jgi:dTDP-4-dehydrorhamnose reductase
MAERPQLKVVADQTGAPTYAPDLAEALLTIAFAASPVPGIFHFTNAGCITWFDFAKAIAALSQSACEVLPITTAEFPTPAKRPAYSLMDCSRLSNTYGITLVPWKESLQKCILSLQ